MFKLGKDIISIIMKMKKEMEYIEQQHTKLLQIANDKTINHILPSYSIINREIVLSLEIKKEKDVGYIPFCKRHLAMKWIEYISTNNNYSSICINIKPIANDYTTEDLHKMINSFYHMKSLKYIYLDGFDDVCLRENTFEEIRDTLETFLNHQNEVSLRFYMEEDDFLRYHFDNLRDITFMDEFWD